MLIIIKSLVLLLICSWATYPWLSRCLNFYSRVARLITSAALGLLVGGGLYIVTIIIGIKSAWLAVGGLVILGFIGQTFANKRVINKSSGATTLVKFHPLTTVLLLIPFGGLVLVTSIKMGIGEFPAFFVNMDTPLILSHVHELLRTDIYPPETLITEGIYHPYHYGGQAAAAFTSNLTGILPHKAMFWLVNPIIILGGFFTLLSFIQSAAVSRFQFVFLFVLFIPFIPIHNELINLISSNNAWEQITFNLIGGVTNNSYNSETFSGGIPATTALSGLFLLLFSSFLLTAKVHISATLLMFITGILIIFCKVDMAPAVFVILGIALIRQLIFERNIAKSLLLIMGLTALPILMMYVLGYFSGDAETSSLTIRSYEEFASHFSWRSNYTRSNLRSLLLMLVLLIPLAGLYALKPTKQNYLNGLIIGLAGFSIAIVTWLLVAIVNIPKTGGQFLGPAWISIPLIAVGYFYALRKHGPKFLLFMFLPFAFIGIQAQWMRINHTAIAISIPEYANEYSNNQLIGDALRNIPVTSEEQVFSDYLESYPDLKIAYQETNKTLKAYVWAKNHFNEFGKSQGREISYPACSDPLLASSINFELYVDQYPDLSDTFMIESNGQSKQEWGKTHYEKHGQAEGRKILKPSDKCGSRPNIVTNDFRFRNWPDSQPQIPALFGHQAYGVHLRHFPGPRGFNREGERRIGTQLIYLSRDFSKSNPKFVERTKTLARERGWGYFLLRKDLDDGLPLIDSTTIPLTKIYENERYAVFKF